MSKNILQDFAALRYQLAQRTGELEAELANINAALRGDNVAIILPARQKPGRKPRTGAAPAPKKTRGKRPKNALSLKEAVTAALKAGPLTKQEILAAVTAAGYRFAAKDPLGSIGTIVYSKAFKNVDGRFSLGLEGVVNAPVQA